MMPPHRVGKGDVLSDLMLLVFRLNARILDKGDQLAAPVQLTSARWQVLGAVALSEQPPTAPQVAQAMGITRQGAQKQLNRMLDEGMFEMCANPRHERSPFYMLTPKGRRAFESVMRLHRRWSGRLAARLSRMELETARNVLESLYERLGTVPVHVQEVAS